MLSLDAQRSLAACYGGQALSDRVLVKLSKGFSREPGRERIDYAIVVMIDIAGFSGRVSSWPPDRIREYLDTYYRLTMPRIYQNGGVIERISGDGILAIFSPVFAEATRAEIDLVALETAETIVASLSGTSHAAKASVSCGKLIFCKTGVASIFEEYTVIGNAITRAYRMEEIAQVDQILVQASSGFQSIIEGQLSQDIVLIHANQRTRSCHVVRRECDLRGIGKWHLYIQTLCPDIETIENGALK